MPSRDRIQRASRAARLATRAGLPIAVLASVLGCGAGMAAVDGSDGGPAPPSACGLPVDGAERAARQAWLADSLDRAIAALETRFAPQGVLSCPPNDGSVAGTVHDLGDYALAKQVLAAPGGASVQSLADAAVRCLFSFQQYVAGDTGPNQGVFSFHFGDPPRLADNSNEFALLPLGTLLPRYPVDAGLAAEIAPRIVAALDAIERHAVCSGYTNICLMQTAVMLSLGQWLAGSADPQVSAYGRARVASGQARLTAWLQFTRGAGITEFASPTYDEVDLEVLLAGRRAAPDEATRAALTGALDYVWASLAANFFPGRGSLSGPLARNYDFVTGMGGISLSYYLEGLRRDLPTQQADLAKGILLLDARAPGGYRPPPRSLCLAGLPVREVLSTYGADGGAGGRQRHHYLTPDFAIGSTSSDYGTSLGSDQDQMLRAELGASSRVPVVALIPDYLDHPGTTVAAGDFDKATHLLMSPASVQKGGAVLALMRIPAKDPKYTASGGGTLPLVNLASNVILPAQADEMRLDGAQVSIASDVLTSARPVLTVRIGGGAVATAVLAASGLECARADGTIAETGAAEVHLKPLAAASSARDASARLAIYHDLALPTDTSTLAPCFARLALLVVGAPCPGAGCAASLEAEISQAARTAVQSWDPSTGDWDVRAALADGTVLHVHRVVGGSHEQVLAREVNGQAVAFPPLAVNGQLIDLTMP
jgi:hypothetical protein